MTIITILFIIVTIFTIIVNSMSLMTFDHYHRLY